MSVLTLFCAVGAGMLPENEIMSPALSEVATVPSIQPQAISKEVTAQGAQSVQTSRLEQCPFTAEVGRIIIDFTQTGTIAVSELEISAEGVNNPATRRYTVPIIPQGTYTIRTVTKKPVSSLPSEYFESWKAELFSAGNKKVFETVPTRDISDGEALVQETMHEIAYISDPVDTVIVQHGGYGVEQSNTVAPLCMAFDRLSIDGLVPENEYTGSLSAQTVQDAPVEQVPRHCPLTPKQGRYIIDFTRNGAQTGETLRLVTDPLSGSIVGPIATKIPKGNYIVRLSGYTPEPMLNKQQWFLELYDKNNERIGQTPTTSDIPDWQIGEFTSKVSDEFRVDGFGAQAFAVHAYAHLNGNTNPVYVLCAAFDAVSLDPTSEEQNDTEVLPRADLF